MNWSLVLRLSLFGLAMGIATVYVVPSSVEPLFWLAIFAITAYSLARAAGSRYFLHGVAVGVANSVWITGSHVLLFRHYIANHPQEAAMMSSMPLPDSPRLMMAMVGPVIGLVSGAVIGLFTIIAVRLLSGRKVPAH